jgi:peptidoglycan hydrolase CwlO-like protein
MNTRGSLGWLCADLIEANIDISGLESDATSWNGAINDSKTKIETNTSNIGTFKSNIGRINYCINSLDDRLTILEGRPDCPDDICNLKNSIFNLQSQIDDITVPDYSNEIRDLNDSISSLQSQVDHITVPDYTNKISRFNNEPINNRITGLNRWW